MYRTTTELNLQGQYFTNIVAFARVVDKKDYLHAE